MIAAKIIVGTAVGIPAASLCINRRLYHIASVRSVTVTKAEKRRQIMVDLAIGLGLPILEMILRTSLLEYTFNTFLIYIQNTSLKVTVSTSMRISDVGPSHMILGSPTCLSPLPPSLLASSPLSMRYSVSAHSTRLALNPSKSSPTTLISRPAAIYVLWHSVDVKSFAQFRLAFMPPTSTLPMGPSTLGLAGRTLMLDSLGSIKSRRCSGANNPLLSLHLN